VRNLCRKLAANKHPILRSKVAQKGHLFAAPSRPEVARAREKDGSANGLKMESGVFPFGGERSSNAEHEMETLGAKRRDKNDDNCLQFLPLLHSFAFGSIFHFPSSFFSFSFSLYFYFSLPLFAAHFRLAPTPKGRLGCAEMCSVWSLFELVASW